MRVRRPSAATGCLGLRLIIDGENRRRPLSFLTPSCLAVLALSTRTVLTSGYAHSSIHPPFRLRHISLTASAAAPKDCSQCRVSVTSISQTLTSS